MRTKKKHRKGKEWFQAIFRPHSDTLRLLLEHGSLKYSQKPQTVKHRIKRDKIIYHSKDKGPFIGKIRQSKYFK